MSWISAVVFETGYAGSGADCPVEKLSNGNFVIAWKETGTGADEGKFAIYNIAGVEIVAPTEFHATNTEAIAIAPLSNGNFFIAYSDRGDGDKGKFVIYDSTGNLIESETQFETGDCSHIGCCAFSDDSVFCAYRQENANLYYVIFDSVGNISVGPTQISGVDPSEIIVLTLANNNVMIVIRDSDDSSKLKALVRDSNGAQVVAAVTLSALNCTQISTCLLLNNDVAISYRASSDSYLQVIQPDTTSVKAETEIEALAYRPKVSVTSAGKIMYIYGDNSNTLQYRIFSAGGTEETGKTAVGNSCITVYESNRSGFFNLVAYAEGDLDGAFRIFDNVDLSLNTAAIKRLVAAANDKIWFEDV